VTGLSKKQVANKFLKNHRALDFDNVSNMQVESTPSNRSSAAHVSKAHSSANSSPTGSESKGDSRMEDADALQ
jgi:hypothetical protein